MAYTTIEADVADDALGGGINTRSNSGFRDVQRGHIRFDANYSQRAIRDFDESAKERPESESTDTGPGWKSCRQKESVISQGSTLFLQDIFFRKAGFLVSWGF